MPTILKAILCDVDGVLVDTEGLHFQAWDWICRDIGGQPLTQEEHATLVGKDGPVIMRELSQMKGFGGDLTKLNDRCREKYIELRQTGNIPVIMENVMLLREFAELYSGLRFAAVSSDTHDHIQQNLRVAGLENFFELAVSAHSDGLKKKPAPDVWLVAMKRLGVAPEECLAFEDSPAGVESVTSAGVRVVALPSPSTVSCSFPTAHTVIKPGERKNAREILARVM
ncbi:MAG: HAD family phosphatase [bacterium]|nr:HAD family phosphatase [bacterium]